MNFQERLKRSFKLRFAIIYPFAPLVLFFCSSDEHSLRAGIGFIIAGILTRLWSNGYAIKNDKLSTCGPYAFVRNPLYVGTFLIALGFTIVLKMNWLAPLLLGCLAYAYYNTIKKEQNDLLRHFGKPYEEYCQHVPAMIPTLTPYTKGEKWPFSMDRLIFSKEHKTGIWVTVILILFHLKTRLLIEHKSMTERSWALVFLAATLILIDIIVELTKKRK